MRVIIKALGILLMVVSVGCTSVYSDKIASGLRDNEVAILAFPDVITAPVFISDIDGKPRGIGWFDTFRLASGKHVLGVELNVAGYRAKKLVVWIDVEAGGRYQMIPVVDSDTRLWEFRVVDLVTGRRVDHADASMQ